MVNKIIPGKLILGKLFETVGKYKEINNFKSIFSNSSIVLSIMTLLKHYAGHKLTI